MTPGKGSQYWEFFDLSGRITCMPVNYSDFTQTDSESFSCSVMGIFTSIHLVIAIRVLM